MKRILRDTCVLFALTTLSVFVISILWMGFTDEIKLVLYLFGLSFVISVANWFLDEFTSLPIIWNYVVKYIVAATLVLFTGFMVGWFYKSNFWMAFIYVGIVFVFAYLIDAVKAKRDIDYINDKIKNKKQKIAQ